MNGTTRFLGFSSLAWALLTLAGLAMMAFVAPLREYDVYNLAGGMRALEESPFLVIAGLLVFAWAGVALVFMAFALNDRLEEWAGSNLLRIAKPFAWIARREDALTRPRPTRDWRPGFWRCQDSCSRAAASAC